MARLHSRIYLHSLLVLVVACVTTAVVFALGARGAFMREVAERAVQHLTTLVAESAHDPADLARRVQQIHRDLDVDVTVRDVEGRLLASSGSELPAPVAEEIRAVLAGKLSLRAGPRWSAASVVRDPQSGVPMAVLQASARHRFGFLHFLHPALAVALVLLIVALATRPLARRLSRPLERLTVGARRLGGGDLSYRVPVAAVGAGAPWRRRGHRATDELEELTRAFNEMADRVERLVRGQRELLANISHELRSPLTRIRMALELLPRDGASEARLRAVERDLADLDRLIDDVLTTARLDATGLPARLDAFDANRLLAEVAERAREDPLLARTPVRFVPGPPLELTADAALLRRALWNLMENAAKYGGPPITLAAEREGDRLVLSVTDEGAGISPADRERVFAPFYRGERARTAGATSEAARGVGLGLTLARRVAEVHSGTITIGPASRVDGRERGCRVVISLPAGGAAC